MDPLFAAKQEEWIDWLGSQDRNSVMQQIYLMIRDAGIYRLINEARRLAPPNPRGGVCANGLIHKFINRGFFQVHLLAVRRLTEPQSNHPSRRVTSLMALVQDIQAHQHLLTRQNLLEAHNIPMDVDYERAEEAHANVDRLCGVKATDRSPGDTVLPAIIASLVDKLSACRKSVRLYVDKFVAHAADPQNRAACNADDVSITLEHLWAAHETICRIAIAIDLYLLRRMSHLVLPHISTGDLVYADRPLIPADQTNEVLGAWKVFERETHKWSDGFFDWLNLAPAAT